MAIKDYLKNEVPGAKKLVGDTFPNFELYGSDFEKHSLAEFSGKKKVILFVPSILTSICDVQTQKLSEFVKDKNVVLLFVCSESPISLSTWCATKGNDHVLGLSLFGDNDKLVKEMGLYLPECPFICYRAAYVLDENNKIVYEQLAEKLKSELNLEEVKKPL